jgi:hypothetical protein
VLLGGLWAWWNFDLRWRPKTIVRNQAEITKLLEQSGWVSPGLPGKKLYMVSFRTCPDCLRFEGEMFPKLHAAGVDTRVIEIARADKNGVVNSTPTERNTVAALWLGRSWKLKEQWSSVPPATWTAPGLPSADGDRARTAVVEAGRQLAEDLRPLLKDNGVRFAYPILVWWDDKGQMRACACKHRESYRFVKKELGI